MKIFVLRNGEEEEESIVLPCTGGTGGKLMLEDFDLDGTLDLIVSCGDTLSVILAENPGEVTLEAPGAGSDIIDFAVANLDGGEGMDVYAVTYQHQMWQFNTETGHMIALELEKMPTSVESFGGGAVVAYGTEEGSLRYVDNQDFEYTDVNVSSNFLNHPHFPTR